jgi:Gp37 protein
MIETIGLAIRDRLMPLQELGIAVRLLPNKVSEYGQAFQDGQITIMWSEDESVDIDSSEMLQEQRVVWALELRLPCFWNETGIDKAMTAIGVLLNGFQPPQGKQLRQRKRQFLGEKDGLWVAIVTFEQRVYVVSAPQDDAVVGTLLREIRLEGNFGDFEVPTGEEI